MKKICLTLLFAVFTVLANAQAIIPVQKGQGTFLKSSEKLVINKSLVNRGSPQRAASLDNTELWGYYLGDIFQLGAIGVNTAATYWVGYYVPGDDLLKGSCINGINLPIYSKTNMKDVSIWISEDLETNLVSQDVDASTLNDLSYNAIALDEPFAIPEGGVYVGVKFTISKASSNGDKFPILADGILGNQYSCIMQVNSSQFDEDWMDYSASFGSFGMQLFCSNLKKTERYAYFKAAQAVNTLAGAEVTLPVMIGSDGTEGVTSIDYIVDINGNKQSKHLDLATPIAGGYSKMEITAINFKAPETYGQYTANISIEKVNGQLNEARGKVLSVTNKTLSKAVTRNSVVEEFTGTGCGYCPRGWVGMEMLKEVKENFIGIAVHKYNTNDPMNTGYYDSRFNSYDMGAPNCIIDRVSGDIDPYYGSSSSYPALGIFDDFDYYNSILPSVDVNVSGMFNEDNTEVNIKADVEYLTDGDEYTVFYVLTADGLKGEANSWKQANYYYTSSPDGDENLAPFCLGGEYGKSSVFLTFNDVMIGSSYSSSGDNLAPALSGDVKVGSKASGTYTIKMPTKAILKSAINNDEVYAVAFVVAGDGSIANAARAKVQSYDATGIENAVSGQEIKEIARYNANGVRLSAPQKGVNIVKLSNGKTVKVVIE